MTNNTFGLMAQIFDGNTIDSFQSRDRLEDLEGKTSIELQHKRLNYSCFPAANIVITSQKDKTKVFLNKMQVLAICNPY